MGARGTQIVAKNRRYLLFFGVFVCVISILYTLKATEDTISDNIEVVKSVKSFFDNKEVHTSGLPSKLQIKKLSIDAPIEEVGIMKDGSMDTPKEPANIGWYSLGPRPGEKGSAVLTGHYGWKDGKAAVFDNLNLLKVGDKVSITDDKGVALSFVVTGFRVYNVKDDAKDVFISYDGAHLNLVTCMGEWNKSQKSYSKRLVVFTSLVQ